jgi:hypothetical protein
VASDAIRAVFMRQINDLRNCMMQEALVPPVERLSVAE